MNYSNIIRQFRRYETSYLIYILFFRLSRFHLRLTRDTNPLTKQLIMMSLSKILNKCLELRLLPSVIMKQFVQVKQRVSRNKHKDSLARNRCNRLTKVLAYAQVILC